MVKSPIDWTKNMFLVYGVGLSRYVSPICHVLKDEASIDDKPVTNEALLTTRPCLKIIVINGF